MGSFPWGVALAVFGVVVPAIAFLYEFVFVGRKRLGYRVQVDTTATGEVASQYAGALQQLQQNGTRLIDPSFVLLRIENNGATHIDTSDYAVLDDDKDSTAGSREPFKAPEIVGGIKCPPGLRHGGAHPHRVLHDRLQTLPAHLPAQRTSPEPNGQ